jgi:hypothetical protein
VCTMTSLAVRRLMLGSGDHSGKVHIAPSSNK